MRENPVTRQRGVSHDRDATICVVYLILSFGLDFFLSRSQFDALHYPWLLSQALGLALIVTIGMRFWFVLFLSVFANSYFIWFEGRSVTAMFLGIVMTAAYCAAAFLWRRLQASDRNVLERSLLALLLSFATAAAISRIAWVILTGYELIDPAPAGLWTIQVAVRDTVDIAATFPFFAFVLMPFLEHLIYRGNGAETPNYPLKDGLFAVLPFLALALPHPPLEFTDLHLRYLVFLPAAYLIYLYRMRAAFGLSFAVQIWLFRAWPFDDLGHMTGHIPFLLTLLVTTYGTAYLLEKRKMIIDSLLAKKEEELSHAHAQIIELEENRREWRTLTQTLERLVIRSTQDLRTPLTPMYMWSQMLKEGDASQAVHDASDGIQMHIERQTKMLEELRDSVRISMGHQHIRQDTFDLSDLLIDLSLVWKDDASRKLLEFRYERPLKPSLILGDREQLSLALQKLFEHLLQFGKEHAIISLHATIQHRDVILHLKHSGYSSDQQHVLKLLQAGQGMDPESLLTATNFDPALYTAKKLIDLQGGRLTAASLNPKPGMLFSLSLKRGSRDAKATAQPSLQTLSGSLPHAISLFTPSHQRLLIVEDDPVTLRLLDRLLTSEGIEVIACNDAHEAIDAFHRLQPSVVLTDLGLPDINGFELIRRLKKAARHEFVAVAFSACVTPEAEQQAFDAGFSAFLAKPLQAKELIETMQALQNQHQHKPYQGAEHRVHRPDL